MLTLSYGFKKPQTPDRGPVVFPALEANWQQVNDHTHDGVNSAKINSASISKTKVTLVAAGWVVLGSGHFKQALNIPGVNNYDDVTLEFRLSTGEIIHPTVIKTGLQQCEVYIDDSTQDLSVLIN